MSISSESTEKIMPALIAARATMPELPKDKVNTFVRSANGQPVCYTSLQATIHAAMPALLGNKLYPQEGTRYNHDTKEIQCFIRLWHESGQWIESTVSVYPRPDKTGFIGSMQVGAPITYARRYCWRLVLGLSDTESDDDGASEAQQHNDSSPQHQAPKQSAYQRQAQKTPVKRMLPAEPLTDPQKQELDIALTEAKPDMEKFLKYMGLTALSEVNSQNFDKAIRALNAKKVRTS